MNIGFWEKQRKEGGIRVDLKRKGKNLVIIIRKDERGDLSIKKKNSIGEQTELGDEKAHSGKVSVGDKLVPKTS